MRKFNSKSVTAEEVGKNRWKVGIERSLQTEGKRSYFIDNFAITVTRAEGSSSAKWSYIVRRAIGRKILGKGSFTTLRSTKAELALDTVVQVVLDNYGFKYED